MYHGCVSYAADRSARMWVSGSGADYAAARADALRRLPGAGFVAVQCSNPPGVLTSAPPAPAAAPAPPTTVTEAPQPSVQADQIYMALISQIPGTVINDPATAVAGGRRICPGLASSGRTATEAAVQANDPGFTPWQASAMVNAAITAYCPQYRGVQ
jgi:serine/threonine-protein kinase